MRGDVPQISSTIYLVRHGETEWNSLKRIQGHRDSPLTEKGLLQARDVAASLRHIRFSAIYSSDLLRAKRTAEIIAREHRLAVVTSKLLRERNFGRFQGKLFSQYNEELKEILDRYYRLPHPERFRFKVDPEVESDEELIARNLTFLREVAFANLGQTVLVVSHGAVMLTLLVHLGYANYSEVPSKLGLIDNTAYIKLESDGVDFFVKETSGISKTEV